MLCCLYCFFKTQTAYEMRMSDWSSDVCSSDLLSITADQIIVTAGAQQALAIAISAMAMPNEIMLVESLTYGGVHENARQRPVRMEAVAMDHEGMLPDAQIGRASCRERVCQYV